MRHPWWAFILVMAGPLAPVSGQVTAAVLRPWGPGNQTQMFWSELNNNWMAYGSAPLVVDHATFLTGFTLQALQAADPQVLVLANPSGGNNQYTPAEVAAIQQFMMTPGKRIVGTYLTFMNGATDNTVLLPLFGLTPAGGLHSTSVTMPQSTLQALVAGHPLLAQLGPSFTTSGYLHAQVPADLTWDVGDYQGTLVAGTGDGIGIVHHWSSGVHDAVFISFMPEYAGGVADRQLVYNALTSASLQVAALTLQGTPSVGSAAGLSLAAPGSPNQPYLIALALQDMPGIALQDGRVIPLQPDTLFWLSLTPGNPILLNGSGILDGNGMTSVWAVALIPNIPALSGVTVFAGAVTLDPSAPAGVGAIAPALPITILP